MGKNFTKCRDRLKGKRFILPLLWILMVMPLQAAVVKGKITDKTTKEPLIGAAVSVVGTTSGVVTNIDGQYEIKLNAGSYTLEFSYVSYTSDKHIVKVTADETVTLDIALFSNTQNLKEVTVTGQAKKNTETALLTAQRKSLVIQTGVSALQISRTQDKDASEVIRRVPGVSLIEEKFVMVRGLSQRYNNVWINNGAVPSSEADARAFSFDIIPSSQLDNIVIVKSPAPEYPADFTGGFILIQTKDVPSTNSLKVNLGAGVNDKTHFRDFTYNKGSGTDFLGFDNGLRSLSGGIHSVLKGFDGVDNSINLLGNGLDNDWTVKNRKPLADMSFGMDFARRKEYSSGASFSYIGAVNYSNSYKSYKDMENSLFGGYDTSHDRSNYLRHSKDNQYNHDARLGVMVNMTFLPSSGNGKYEFKNIFNQLGKTRYTLRNGISAQNNQERSAEYYYNSRTTYNGQLTGKYTLKDDGRLDWSAGYAYANRNMPDRRRYLIDDSESSDGILALATGNDINREFTKLDEHIFSANVNWVRPLTFGAFTPTLKAGAYGEYRTRSYSTREFIYTWNAANNTLPYGFKFYDLPSQLLKDENYGLDKLYMLEQVNWTNSYDGNNQLYAGYAAFDMPFGKLDIYAGVRYEHNRMEIIRNLRKYEKSHSTNSYDYNDFFPSVNMSFKLDEKQVLRASYGRSVNRPEFRELSPSVFYDFDLASDVQGNYALAPAYIHNLDLRYEWYPSNGEEISLALFYKNFKDPIEWTYTVSGGTDLVYSFINAKGADNYGAELDIRKDLSFIGLKNFSFSFNGSLIKSKVRFEPGSKEMNRPMQGQSPYLVNTGIFYTNDKSHINVGLLYNRIGKRIIGVGRSQGTTVDDNSRIPDSYEMPRNAIDLNFSKKFGKHWEARLSARDLLAEKVTCKQFAKVTVNDAKKTVEQITRQYRPGHDFNMSLSYLF